MTLKSVMSFLYVNKISVCQSVNLWIRINYTWHKKKRNKLKLTYISCNLVENNPIDLNDYGVYGPYPHFVL